MTLLESEAGRLPDASLPLIGRDAELADLERALTAPDTRLLTLTGPPGVGKTRLALAAARAVAARFGNGVVFVDLAPVQDPGLVLVEVARALGLRDGSGGSLTGLVSHAIADKHVLLLVDNCEQVLAAARDLAALLQVCAGLRLLVTSRERLYLGAEREVPVPPLALPRPGDTADPTRLAGIPAVAMLVARVRYVQPDFAVTDANAEAIAEICHRLDGLPLALELTAPRAKLFTLAELAVRLRHRMGLLTSGAHDAPVRHRTLRTALEWSHDLLGPDERALFRRVSVFFGDWTLDAAGRVCADPGADVLDTVASLVDKSLVQRSARQGEVAEFVLLESMREFAAELLSEHDDLEITRARHAAYFAELATAQEARIGLPAEAGWWRESTASDEANLASALDHCLDAGETTLALHLAAALGWHSYFRGNLGAGQAQLRRALASEAEGRASIAASGASEERSRPASRPSNTEAEGRASIAASGASEERSRPASRPSSTEAEGRASIAASGASEERSRPASRPDDALAGALVIAGVLAWTLGELDAASAELRRGLEISEAAGDARRTAIASSFLGHLARAVGRHEEARARHEHAAVLYRRIPSASGYAWTRYDLGLLAKRQGDLDTAAKCLQDGLMLFREIDYAWAIGRCAWALAAVRLRRSETDQAAALLAEALERHEQMGDGRGLAQCLESAAGVACARGFPDAAARLLGAAAGRRDRLAAPLPDEDRDAHDAVERAVRKALGDDGTARSKGAGRALRTADAVALARTVVVDQAPDPHGTARARGGPAGPDADGAVRLVGALTSRERQVAELIAKGRTNRQIGRALGIAEKTVEVHVHHVIAKLGARSRTEVAAWVVAHHQPLPGSPDSPV